MASQNPASKILEVSPDDYTEIVELENTVFNDDPLVVYAYGPTRASPSNIAHRVQSLASPPRGFTARMRKVVDPESGAIVGFSQWKFFYEPWIVNPPAEEKNEDAENSKQETAIGHAIGDGGGKAEEKEQKSKDSIWPEGSNVELCEKAFIGADKIREREFAGKRHVALNILVILQSHQRRGLGKMLLKDGLDEADRHNLPCWVASSEPAQRLYESNGFVVDEVMQFDMRQYGGDVMSKHIVMFRPAMGKKEA